MSENKPVELVTCTIDGQQVSVPKGTLIIRAAESIGTAIPRFCDHPLLDPAGACRECLSRLCRREVRLLLAGDQGQGQKGQQAALERRHRGTIRTGKKAGRQA